MRGTTRRGFLVSVAATVAVASCGRVRDSRLNPFNWFGRSREETVEALPDGVFEDGRRLVEVVGSLNVDQTPEGAIVRAVGVNLVQGFWDADLVERQSEDPSRLIYEFRIQPPLFVRRQGPQQSREVIVATDVSSFRLRGIRSITVIGRTNQRTVRR